MVETQEELMSWAVKREACQPTGSHFLGEANVLTEAFS